jgi:transposase
LVLHRRNEKMPVNDVVPPEGVTLLLQRLDRIEETLAALVARQAVKEWYSTDEVAKLLGKAEFTVREWCRLGRVRAEKKGSGRGKYQSWVVSHAELRRVQREGLLPLKAGG